jgi:hypothetical protein
MVLHFGLLHRSLLSLALFSLPIIVRRLLLSLDGVDGFIQE